MVLFTKHYFVAVLCGLLLLFPLQLVRSFAAFQRRNISMHRKYHSKLIYFPLNSNPNNFEKEEDTTDNNPQTIETQNEMDPIYILPISTTVLIGIGFLCIGYIKMTNPSSGIDVDFYMALDDILNKNNNDQSILALPPLSPAEKIVGALFGPPNSNNY